MDDVDTDTAGLLEALQPMDRLNEVVELEVDTDVDRSVAVPLEVAAGSG